MKRFILIALLLLAPGAFAHGAEPATQPASAPHSAENKHDADSHTDITHSAITVDGQVLHYEVTTGTLTLKDESNKPRADFFFVAYRLEDSAATQSTTAPAASTRPITFVFNGGPGAAAVWLHMGALGPRRIDTNAQGLAIGPPYRLADNPQTWLTFTDLVFIDPVGTGYSRAAEGVKAIDFYGVQADIESVGEFIRLYTTRYQRWLSPKFLAGESYGTTRAAALSQYLLDRLGMQLNGIVFISSVLDFQTLIPSGESADLPYMLSIPSFTATAWYHHKLPADLQNDFHKALTESQEFAEGDYLHALTLGGSLDAAKRKEVIGRLARYTGLNEDFIDRSNLRVGASAFRKELLNDQRKVVGRFDTRITGDDEHPANDSPDFDPSFNSYFAAYTATFSDYVRRDLKYSSDLNYEVLSGKVHPWGLGAGGNGPGWLDVASSLDAAMHANPHLKVMFASGYFDLATPFLITDFTIDHMNLSPALRANITRTFYESGHMVYHPLPMLKKLHDDAAGFYEKAEAP